MVSSENAIEKGLRNQRAKANMCILRLEPLVLFTRHITIDAPIRSNSVLRDMVASHGSSIKLIGTLSKVEYADK